MKTLPLAEQLIPWVAEGRKTSTVRLGRRNYQIGKAALVSREIKIPIEILDVAYATVGDLDEVTAVSEGYGSIDDLKKELTHFYPSIGEDSEITIVRFRVI